MTRVGRWAVLLVLLAVVAVGCTSASQVNSSSEPPTPLPTAEPVFIPTTAPPPPTPVAETAADAEDTPAVEGDEGSSESQVENDAGETEDASETAGTLTDEGAAEDQVAATPTVVPTPTADVLPVPTRAPQPTRAVQPTPRPTAAPAPACPRGQVLTGTGCTCPAGTLARPADGQCVRLCNQADLTISNTCVCTGELYDNGGQCVKRCLPNEVPDGVGGCKIPGPEPIN